MLTTESIFALIPYGIGRMFNGIIGGNIWVFTDRNAAESKYYSVLSAAAISSVEKHSVILVTDEGHVLLHACYKHPVESIEPEE